MRLIFPIILSLAFVAGCKEDDVAMHVPDPLELTQEAAGHYCQMIILDHVGPKAQAHFANGMNPLWFSQARDGLAYILSPEEEAEVIVLYVNDMGEAESWDKPGIGNWIKARDAFFVVGSDALGGMGTPELVPFGNIKKANSFATKHGGKVMRLDEIPIEAVLSPIKFNTDTLEQT